MIHRAERRIFLSSLYIGSEEGELVSRPDTIVKIDFPTLCLPGRGSPPVVAEQAVCIGALALGFEPLYTSWA